jgi:hexosaminidase
MTRYSILTALAFPFILLVGSCGPEGPKTDPTRYPVIPIPSDMDARRGDFVLDRETRITVSPADDGELRELVDRWVQELRGASGLPLPVVALDDAGTAGVISVEVTGLPEGARPVVAPGMGLPGVEAEKYELEVSAQDIHLEAPTAAGAFYGLETLRQLARAPVDLPTWSIPAVEIEDTPRFPYRGMHLDVGRHFFPVSFIKRYIDLLAAYKMNVFHWHLTEDQGWRLEIQGYPRLAEVASCRSETILEKNFDPYVGDGEEYCGYYTQAEAREIVEYARERFITVMPEIEMPGHSVAALAAYPEFGCTPGPFEVATVWGVHQDIYCPREETFAFLEDVLTEVMEIFPSPYIHIGADEAPKTVWEESELAQEVIRREGLADEHELQSWFIRRIEEFLNANGRRLMGWDEILEGGLAPNATVMSWRGMEGGIEAAQQGHDVVMTPTGYAYFDYYQGDSIGEPLAIGGNLPLERVYSLEPVPPELNESEAGHILGAQANMWTEYIKTTEHLEYMLLPRMLAMSEVAWSPAEQKVFEHFTERLLKHFARFDEWGVTYRDPASPGLPGVPGMGSEG